MKIKTKIFFMVLLSVCFNFGCSPMELQTYDTEVSRIYVDMPLKEGSNSEKADELSYSFAWDDNSVQTQIINMPLTVVGVAVDFDRAISLSVIADKTTALDADWDTSSIVDIVVPKGETQINIPITIKRSEALKTESKEVYIKINENEYFKVLTEELSVVKVRFSDILEEPSWWNNYVRYFGPYYPEVYRQWRIIYYEGYDTSINYGNNLPLYWDNMPSYFSASWYPVLSMAMTIMKTYFEENDIYPNGDTTQAPIRLP